MKDKPKCPTCGAYIGKKAKFCSHCGRQLGEPTPEAQESGPEESPPAAKGEPAQKAEEPEAETPQEVEAEPLTEERVRQIAEEVIESGLNDLLALKKEVEEAQAALIAEIKTGLAAAEEEVKTGVQAIVDDLGTQVADARKSVPRIKALEDKLNREVSEMQAGYRHTLRMLEGWKDTVANLARILDARRERGKLESAAGDDEGESPPVFRRRKR